MKTTGPLTMLDKFSGQIAYSRKQRSTGGRLTKKNAVKTAKARDNHQEKGKMEKKKKNEENFAQAKEGKPGEGAKPWRDGRVTHKKFMRLNRDHEHPPGKYSPTRFSSNKTLKAATKVQKKKSQRRQDNH